MLRYRTQFFFQLSYKGSLCPTTPYLFASLVRISISSTKAIILKDQIGISRVKIAPLSCFLLFHNIFSTFFQGRSKQQYHLIYLLNVLLYLLPSTFGQTISGLDTVVGDTVLIDDLVISNDTTGLFIESGLHHYFYGSITNDFALCIYDETAGASGMDINFIGDVTNAGILMMEDPNASSGMDISITSPSFMNMAIAYIYANDGTTVTIDSDGFTNAGIFVIQPAEPNDKVTLTASAITNEGALCLNSTTYDQTSEITGGGCIVLVGSSELVLSDPSEIGNQEIYLGDSTASLTMEAFTDATITVYGFGSNNTINIPQGIDSYSYDSTTGVLEVVTSEGSFSFSIGTGYTASSFMATGTTIKYTAKAPNKASAMCTSCTGPAMHCDEYTQFSTVTNTYTYSPLPTDYTFTSTLSGESYFEVDFRSYYWTTSDGTIMTASSDYLISGRYPPSTVSSSVAPSSSSVTGSSSVVSSSVAPSSSSVTGSSSSGSSSVVLSSSSVAGSSSSGSSSVAPSSSSVAGSSTELASSVGPSSSSVAGSSTELASSVGPSSSSVAGSSSVVSSSIASSSAVPSSSSVAGSSSELASSAVQSSLSIASSFVVSTPSEMTSSASSYTAEATSMIKLAHYTTIITSGSSTITAVVSGYETTDSAGSTYTATSTYLIDALAHYTTTITSSSSTITAVVSECETTDAAGSTYTATSTSVIDALAHYTTTITSGTSTITAVVSECETTDAAGSTYTATSTSVIDALPAHTTKIAPGSSPVTSTVWNESVGSIDGNTNRSRATSAHPTLANELATGTTILGESDSDTAKVLSASALESTTVESSITAATGFSASSTSVNNPKQPADNEYSTTTLISSTTSGIIYQGSAPSIVMRKSLKALVHCLFFALFII
ncbi:hypothetical protein KAFR_0F02720 [Kazachstania africana CBS 2517]|uniref:Hyphally-regulated cell wall protein N-terminal domain-containing protein n=1 Tax=Kazachstania africana (strain ATCC 22294 / BCRC 22015 / CBS 2517 / CECT 1963 / NBRC 1671 / NRRL Y-8276) TaxID=1071382 RepID=H2AWW9_KAZAF|nr:hypothetical protein KAFR_0F02720 [Kazachstania africana CBS 2517]CCF58869.1 hypothetical protein KAFR_0F02720 [Kazachstania africana CBS 2517]